MQDDLILLEPITSSKREIYRATPFEHDETVRTGQRVSTFGQSRSVSKSVEVKGQSVHIEPRVPRWMNVTSDS